MLGNGTLALILDIAAMAARAGVKALDERTTEETSLEKATTGVQFLVVEQGRHEKSALPLKVVERIETVPLRSVEYAGGEPLLQYRGELLRLEDKGGVLTEAVALSGTEVDRTLTVLICEGGTREDGRAGRRVGMVVRQVLDVAVGEVLPGGCSRSGSDLVLIKNAVLRLDRDMAGMGEVAR